MEILAHPSKDSEYNPDKWWKDRPSAKHLFFEYIKLIWYQVVERFNLNKSEVNKPEQKTFYGGTEKGYTDYPLYSA